ncbi:hypothetical protein SS50377_28205 [Spironucleus salmonicida]|uniref:Uncharacterized protein n=1 Tax=Spironucleus salmonicida TaxID=348837 RepID=A0A9P8RV31_9EUKA|nr:hypothetical protein SS50377_28205 [Spironucleus salmonicida]
MPKFNKILNLHNDLIQSQVTRYRKLIRQMDLKIPNKFAIPIIFPEKLQHNISYYRIIADNNELKIFTKETMLYHYTVHSSYSRNLISGLIILAAECKDEVINIQTDQTFLMQVQASLAFQPSILDLQIQLLFYLRNRQMSVFELSKDTDIPINSQQQLKFDIFANENIQLLYLNTSFQNKSFSIHLQRQITYHIKLNLNQNQLDEISLFLSGKSFKFQVTQ